MQAFHRWKAVCLKGLGGFCLSEDLVAHDRPLGLTLEWNQGPARILFPVVRPETWDLCLGRREEPGVQGPQCGCWSQEGRACILALLLPGHEAWGKRLTPGSCLQWEYLRPLVSIKLLK